MKNKLLAFISIGILTVGCSTPDIINIDKSGSPTSEVKIGNNKIRMYVVYKHGCYACESMQRHMQTPEIRQLLEREFIIKRVNIRNKSSLPHAWMRPYSAPTIYFLDKDRKEIISSINSMSSSRFLQTLQEAVAVRDMR